jgi:transcriptional regulator of aromatic amino acid metabolism
MSPQLEAKLPRVTRDGTLQRIGSYAETRTEAARATGISHHTLVHTLQHLRELGFDVDGR